MSNTKKKKKKSPWKSILIIVLFLICSFGVGWLAGTVLDPIIDELPPKKFFAGLAGIYIFLLLFGFFDHVHLFLLRT